MTAHTGHLSVDSHAPNAGVGSLTLQLAIHAAVTKFDSLAEVSNSGSHFGDDFHCYIAATFTSLEPANAQSEYNSRTLALAELP